MSSAPPGRTVVLVEDNPADVELMREALAQSPRPPVVRHFTAGGDALAHLRAAADVDLVLLDINLPGISGLDVVRTIKQDPALQHLPVVIFTTSNSDRHREQAYENLANCYLVKPIDVDEFFALVRMVERLWLTPGTPGAK